MKTLTLFVFAMIQAGAAFAQNATLQDSSYLRKLSMHVRGYPPSPAEYTELKSAQTSSATAAFFNKKIADYLASDDHAFKLSVRLEELFRLKTTPTLPRTVNQAFDPSGAAENALNNLFLSLAKENLSWDELLVAKKYKLTNGKPWGGIDDFNFIKAVLPDVPAGDSAQVSTVPADVKTIEHQFDANDNRIAGALTTARFFNRYNTTEMNKNRRRAAAVFNIFLCDSMSPAIPEPPSSPDELLKKAFPGQTAETEQQLKQELASNDRHGSDQACMQCHYKLDPAGQVFMKSNRGLSPTAAFGHLTYKDMKTGKLVDEPVNGLGELGQAIVRQDQYARCQVRTFWNWFIGSDRPLTDDREQQLIGQFNQAGRKTNDFIAILLHAPEFRTRDFTAQAQIRVLQVKSVLKNCTECHDNKGEDIPDFTKFPIGGSKESMQKWSAKIGKALDFINDGANRKMPPKDSGWQLSTDDFQLLKLWFGDGAPNENGETQL